MRMTSDPVLVMTPKIMPVAQGSPVDLWCSGDFPGNVMYEFIEHDCGRSRVVQSGSSDTFDLPSVQESAVYTCSVTCGGLEYTSREVTVTVVGK